ncbi:GntR family transcriptional regulator [Streptomyces hydrogenans]|uniref:GntR family transcriptional regulator n=1 Tax=Streptomyces hydrogenans TaxID=1873719 RepID=UPI0035DE43BB
MSDVKPSSEPLDPQSATPLYVQLAEIISKQIASGALAPDRPIPSENRMAEEYGVARLTARRATQELRERGLVITVRGKGSYVTPAPEGTPTPRD